MTRGTLVRWATICGGILAALLLLEIILQAGSLLVWWGFGRRAGGEPELAEIAGARVVLCIGDSFTFGSGSSSPQMAYPKQLERSLLETQGETPAWRVVNAGWPGRNSTELLRSLPELLARSHPRYVCILVGLNNRWSRAEPESAAQQKDVKGLGSRERFVWRWRTVRLLRIVVDAIRTRGERATVEPGSSASSRSPSTAGSSSPAREPSAELERVQKLLAYPDSAASARSLALAARSRIRAQGDPASSALLAHLLFRLGLRGEAVAELEHALETHGETPKLCQTIVSPLARLGRTEEALGYARRAVHLAPDDPESYRGLALAWKLSGNTAETLRALARGFALDGDDEYLLRQFRRRQLSQVLTPEQTGALLKDLPLDDTRKETFLVLYRRSREDVDLASRLETDLLAACDLVRRRGATPLILTYPLRGVAADAVEILTEVARAEDVPLVSMIPAFEEALATHAPEALFVPDGHCTDLGYNLMAREVAAAILRLEDSSR